MNSFHNTTLEPDPKLFEVKARTQEQIILDIFRSHENLTASEVHKLYLDIRIQIRSVGRGITNLATDYYRKNGAEVTKFHVVRISPDPAIFPMCELIKAAKLFKTNIKRIGPYGRNEYAYKIINRI
jgi:hypothetical protein